MSTLEKMIFIPLALYFLLCATPFSFFIASSFHDASSYFRCLFGTNWYPNLLLISIVVFSMFSGSPGPELGRHSDRTPPPSECGSMEVV
jgi:hypothetical protein